MTTQTTPLDVGFLGYRFMGKAHANALARLPMVFPETPAVNRDVIIGRDEEALSDAADQLGFDRTARDWESVVEEVDVLYNLAPNHLHVEPSIAALEAGTHVLCEKPLAPTIDGAQRMLTAARNSEARACCSFNYRFVPAIQHARELITSGELGEIHHFRGQYMQDWLVDPEAPWSWRNDEKLAGSGALGDLGAHTIDLARFLVGDRTGDIDRVSGQLRTFVDERPVETPTSEAATRPVTVDDAYSAQLTFESDAMGTIEASRFATGHKNDHSIAVHGSEGSLRFSLERLNELEILRGDREGYETVLVTEEEHPYVDAWWPPGHVLGWEHPFVHENYEFLNPIVSDASASDALPTFEDGYRVQEVLAAIEASDANGEWMSV
jgi:predicted dehydrogenase